MMRMSVALVTIIRLFLWRKNCTPHNQALVRRIIITDRQKRFSHVIKVTVKLTVAKFWHVSNGKLTKLANYEIFYES